MKVSEMAFNGQIGDIVVNKVSGEVGYIAGVGKEYVKAIYPNATTLTPKRCFNYWHGKPVFDKQMDIFEFMEERNEDKGNN